MAILKTVIFQRMHEKPTKFKKYLLQVSGNVPVGLCRHILPGASARLVAGSWSDLSCSVWERSVLFCFLAHSLKNIFQIILMNVDSLDAKCPMGCGKV